MSKKISIITINYNDKIGLTKTIESVKNQTYNLFEFIIIDGGSTDGSTDVIAKYNDKIDYAISEKDSGVFNAMNKGIRAANGEFVLFMNGGDCFENNNILHEIVPLLNDQYDIYYGNNYKATPNSKRLKTYPSKLNFSFFYTSSINHQSTFIRKSLFDKYFYYNENYKIASDWEFFVYTICYKNVPYRYIDKTIAIYDFTGISSRPESSQLFEEEKNQTIKNFFPAFHDDYKVLSELNSKRFLQFQYIKKYKFAWKLLKLNLNFLLLFLPYSTSQKNKNSLK